MLATVAILLACRFNPPVCELRALSPFVHLTLAHALIALALLWVCGDNLEARLGRTVLVGGFVGSGLLADLVAPVLLHGGEGAGAHGVGPLGGSAAMAAVIGAYVGLMPSSRVLLLVPLPPWIVEIHAAVLVGAWWIAHVLWLVAVPVLQTTAQSNPASPGVTSIGIVAAIFVASASAAGAARRRVTWKA
jgi:membrane associated rhomboid family serine protease